MTVFGYVRVSTVQQATEGDSLDSQTRQVLSYSISRGLELSESDVFVERGVSGGLEFNSRPEGSRLLEVIKSGDVLIFPKLDRGFRNTRDALNTLHLLKEKGVSVHSIDLGGDVTGNGVGAIIFTILSAFASFERERIASRISEVKQMRKSQGFYVGGRRGFGFNVKDGKKVPNSKEQKLIAEMKKKKANGESMLAIHRWLNNEMGTRLNYSSLRKLLVE
ncbi:recombinase family protein [Polynucleobacter victoriensis]|uniref:Site-specific DNA recombinase n=1 Tax=Polynucleobacter victoriensis TaxID=2049319 RepID=A0A212T6S1_9BURK|nr:recombinase family protein [Polynucleobacter victoriensis]SNC61732.1 Site-specific DNA recombinase [Polynucleobacter victoriensis]